MASYSPTPEFLKAHNLSEHYDDVEQLRYIFRGVSLDDSPICMMVDETPDEKTGEPRNKIALVKQTEIDGVDLDIHTVDDVQHYQESEMTPVFFGWVPSEEKLLEVMAYTKWLEPSSISLTA